MSVSYNNDDLTTKLVQAEYIKSHAIEKAFRTVDRANYVLEDPTAYSDHAWKSRDLHVSAPCIYAQVFYFTHFACTSLSTPSLIGLQVCYTSLTSSLCETKG